MDISMESSLQKMVKNGFCGLYAYFAVIQRNIAKTSDYVKATYEVTFLLFLFTQVWRLDNSGFLCYNLV